MRKKMYLIILVVFLITSLAACGGAQKTEPQKAEPAAPKYPTKPITLVVPYAPGGSSDMSARPMAEVLGTVLGQNIVVVNKPGAGGSVGASEVARSQADGYTLFNGSNGPLEIVPYTTDVPYVPSDLKPVARSVSIPIAIAVHKDSPFKSLQEVIDYAKKNPDKLECGSPGVGVIQHLALEAFKAAADIKITHVPFEGANPAVAALLGGHVDMTFTTTPEVFGHYKSGALRILATSQADGGDRLSIMPDVPSIKEVGYDVFLSAWYGVLAPKDTPDEIVNVIAEGCKKAGADPKVREAWEKLSLIPAYLGPAEFKAQIEKNGASNKKLLEEIGLAKK